MIHAQTSSVFRMDSRTSQPVSLRERYITRVQAPILRAELPRMVRLRAKVGLDGLAATVAARFIDRPPQPASAYAAWKFSAQSTTRRNPGWVMKLTYPRADAGIKGQMTAIRSQPCPARFKYWMLHNFEGCVDSYMIRLVFFSRLLMRS